MNVSTRYCIRPATVDDAGVIAAQREAMWKGVLLERGQSLPDQAFFTAQSPLWLDWLSEVMPSGVYSAWLAECGGEVVGGAGLLLRPRMPMTDSLGATEGQLTNIWVAAAHRGFGLGRSLTEAAMSGARQRGIQALSLNGSAAGQALYESLGFVLAASPEMRLTLEAVS